MHGFDRNPCWIKTISEFERSCVQLVASPGWVLTEIPVGSKPLMNLKGVCTTNRIAWMGLDRNPCWVKTISEFERSCVQLVASLGWVLTEIPVGPKPLMNLKGVCTTNQIAWMGLDRNPCWVKTISEFERSCVQLIASPGWVLTEIPVG